MFQATASYGNSYDFSMLLKFYRFHQIPNVEVITELSYKRSFVFEGCAGTWTASDCPARSELSITIDHPSANMNSILSRIEVMLSLKNSQEKIANQFESAQQLRSLFRKFKGARLPFAWDFFEVGIVTILSQFVSSHASRKLLGCLVENLGESILVGGEHFRLFPTYKQILQSNLGFLGTTKVRRKTIYAFAEACENGLELKLSKMRTLEMEDELKSIYGFGQWTTKYFAMRGCRSSDSFPATDLVLKRYSSPEVLAEIEILEPYRSYAAILLWLEYAFKTPAY